MSFLTWVRAADHEWLDSFLFDAAIFLRFVQAGWKHVYYKPYYLQIAITKQYINSNFIVLL